MEQTDKAQRGMHLVNDLRRLDSNGGVVVQTTCWRPRPGDPNPEQPGERVSILSYHPTDAKGLCPCGSGKSFGACCRPLPYWRPVCPNPGMQGYSLMHPQSARFTTILADKVYAFLQDDKRLYCVEDSPRRALWTYWGNPAFNIPQGTLCFGDIELLESRTLLITALSDACMKVLLELVRPLNLSAPQMQRDPLPRVEKPGRKAKGEKRRRTS
jgi:hypothetical protein